MIILGIETSCDETALSIIEVKEGEKTETEITILSNGVLSQIEMHKQYGGVFPNLAKREHAKNLLPLFKKVLEEAGFSDLRFKIQDLRNKKSESDLLSTLHFQLSTILEREPELLTQFLEFIPTIEKPPIDLIAVTKGPGLEPALWVGINFAKALSIVWNTPVVPTNHMEGHILVSLLKRDEEFSIFNFQFSKIKPARYTLHTPNFPALALLISGGHTELVLMKDWLNYEIVGRTRDDAVGEAFDKVARILGLPYPGGPEISRLAETARRSISTDNLQPTTYNFKLPRPMLRSDNLDFSLSGLKTAVLYLVKKIESGTQENHPRASASFIRDNPRLQMEIAREFEDAVTEVIVEKVKKAIEMYGVRTLILGGGVVANNNIRTAFGKLASNQNITLNLPTIEHATDNALMIALAGYFNRQKAVSEKTGLLDVKAHGNLHF